MLFFDQLRRQLFLIRTKNAGNNNNNDDLHARLDTIQKQLENIERKIALQEVFSHGGRATYVGNNRVLTKIVVANMQIALLVEADDRLISPWFIATGGYETPLTNFFVRELGVNSHCLDVGANFGYFTCLMARFCPKGRVIGIEADQHVYEIARDNVLINGFGDIAQVIHAAASNDNAKTTLYRRKTRSGNTSIIRVSDEFTSQMAEEPSERFVVRSVRIDDLLNRMEGRVDFIKIDVEGAEPLVFDGAEVAISSNPNLTLVVEWSPHQIAAAGFNIRAFLASLDAKGLRPFDLDLQGMLMPLTFDELLNLPYRPGIAFKKGGGV